MPTPKTNIRLHDSQLLAILTAILYSPGGRSVAETILIAKEIIEKSYKV